MGRFDRILTPRLQVEVNLPNYNVRKSMEAAARRQERVRKHRQAGAQPGTKAVEPVHLGVCQQEADSAATHSVVIEL